MIKKIFLFFFIISGNFLFAQTPIIDSLEKVLKTQKEDSNRVNIIVELGHQYFRNNYDSTAMNYWKEAIILSEKINFGPGKANAFFWMGQHYQNEGNQPKARRQYFEAIKIAENLKNKSMVGDFYMNIATTFWIEDNYPEVLSNTYLALRHYEEVQNKAGISACYMNFGNYYFSQRDFPEALKNQKIALKVAEESADEGGIAGCKMALADTYMKLGNYTEALSCDSAGLVYAKKKNYKGSIATCLESIGRVFEMQGLLFHTNGDTTEANRKYSEAEKNYLESEKLWEEMEDKLSVSYGLINLGRINTHLNKFSEASKWLDQGIELSKKMGGKDNIKGYYYAITLLDSAQGNFQKAFEDHKLYDLYRDSLSNDQISRRAMSYKSQYETEKKDALAEAELNRQKLLRNSFVTGFTIVFLFAGVFFSQRNKIKSGKKRSDELLLNILPSEVAEELKEKGSADAKQFDEVTVMFTDFKGFTQISEKLSPTELVNEIHTCFKAFDNIIGKHNIEKIKTIGDSYMCAGGLPVTNTTNATDVVKAAIEIQKFMLEHLQQRKSEGKEIFEIRIGIHTGPVVAGIVGIKKFAYDIWGDTVNIASRMESSGEAGKVNISGSTYQLVKDKFNCIHRGKIQAKNKGEIDMYFVERSFSEV